MREILVNHAHARAAKKRGGDRKRVTLGETRLGATAADPLDVVALDEALQKLESREDSRSARFAQIVEMRLFAGMQTNEIAEYLQLTRRTVERDLKTATMLLLADVGD